MITWLPITDWRLPLPSCRDYHLHAHHIHRWHVAALISNHSHVLFIQTLLFSDSRLVLRPIGMKYNIVFIIRWVYWKSCAILHSVSVCQLTVSIETCKTQITTIHCRGEACIRCNEQLGTFVISTWLWGRRPPGRRDQTIRTAMTWHKYFGSSSMIH